MHCFRIWLWSLTGSAILCVTAFSQPPEAPPEGVEVLAKGPIHEAFATTAEPPVGGYPIVPKAPPELIEELPPDQKPDGENVQWIPGYWHYDEDRSDYIWISGFWRVPPPGRVWLPGSWREAQGGFQWVPGFWQELQEKPDFEYLPPPPASIETAPSVPSPGDTFVYVPGCWEYHGRYKWRAGYWIDHRPGWIWCPAHYRWTPAGYVFINGYWDYPLAERGILFAPVYYTAPIYSRPRYVFTPSIVVSEPCLYTSLFVRRGWGCYYFGDYFEARYVSRGFNPWCGGLRTSGFAISIGFGRGPVYDPLWDYYRVSHRHNHAWVNGVNTVYSGRYNGSVARPPVTLVQQGRVINNTTVVNNNVTNVTNNVTNMTILTSISNAQTTRNTTNNKVVLKPIDVESRTREQKIAAETRAVGKDRKRVETTLAERGIGPARPTDAPRTAKIEVPKSVVARAQIPEAKKADIPPPAPKLANQPTPKVTPAPKVDLKPANQVPPRPDLKEPSKPSPKESSKPVTQPPVTPKVGPLKPVKPPLPPKVDPPKPVPPSVPKVDPPKPVPPSVPKVDPPKPVPPPVPKVDPPKPVPPPKIEPPKPVLPKVDPPKPVPPPLPPRVVTPRVDPPKPVSPSPKPSSPPKSGEKPKDPKKPH